MSEAKPTREAPPEPDRPAVPVVVDSAQLFHGRREVWIEHAGERYHLRITRRNKLILQK